MITALLKNLTKKVICYPVWVISICIIFAGFSLYYTQKNLKFQTSRNDLIGKNHEYNKLYLAYRNEFNDFDGLILVVEVNNAPLEAELFMEEIVQRLHAHSEQFPEIFYKIDTQFFKDHFLLYMKPYKIQELFYKIQTHHWFIEHIRQNPHLLGILQALNQEVSRALVSHLGQNFLNTKSRDNNLKKEKLDLSLINSILSNTLQILKNPQYQRWSSPWNHFLTSYQDDLKSKGYLVSKNQKLMFLLTDPADTNDSFSDSNDAIDLMRHYIAEVRQKHPMINAGLTGSEALSEDEMSTVQKDTIKSGIISFIGVALMFIYSYKSFLRPMLAMASLTIALFWTLGFTTFAIGHLNVLSVVFTTILIGLGDDFGIHYIYRFHEERSKGHPIEQSLLETSISSGQGILIGALTTSLAFAAIMLSRFEGLAELGIIAAMGVLFCLITMFTFLPACLAVGEKYTKNKYIFKNDSVQQSRWCSYIFANPKISLWIGLIISIFSIAILPKINFNYNLLDLQSTDVESVIYERKIIEESDRSTWYAAIVAPDMETAREYKNNLKKFSSIEKIESITTLIPKDQEKKIQLIQSQKETFQNILQFELSQAQTFEWKQLKRELDKLKFKLRSDNKNWDKEQKPEEYALELASQTLKEISALLETPLTKLQTTTLDQYNQFLIGNLKENLDILKKNFDTQSIQLENLPQTLKDRFIGKTGKVLLQIFSTYDIFDHDKTTQFIQDLRSVDPKVTGVALQIFESSQLMKNGFIRAGLYALLAILILVLLTFRNFLSTLLALLPLILGALWTVGFMYITGIDFNLANLIVLPPIIGIGMAHGIHMIHRFKEEKTSAYAIIAGSTGRAIILSSLTTMFGFGSLMFAHHRGIYSVGLLFTLGVGSCLLVAVTILPIILEWTQKKGYKL